MDRRRLTAYFIREHYLPPHRLTDFVRGMNARGGMVTVNTPSYQDGGIGEGTLASCARAPAGMPRKQPPVK